MLEYMNPDFVYPAHVPLVLLRGRIILEYMNPDFVYPAYVPLVLFI